MYYQYFIVLAVRVFVRLHVCHRCDSLPMWSYQWVNSERYSDVASIYSHNAVSEATPTVAEASELLVLFNDNSG